MPAAWTTPRTWSAGELVTAAIGNSAWRDNLMYLKDSPTFDGSVTVTGTTLLTGVATFTAAPVFSAATASQAVFTNGSKALVSNAITGTGNVVMSASPTLTGTIAGAAMTLSSTLGVTGATTLSSTVATGALTVTGAATVSTTLGVTGAITSATSVGLTGTTNNLGTITTGVWNAGAVTSSGGISGTTGAFSSTVTGGTYNGQTISSAANFTGTLAVGNKVTITAPRSGTPGTTALNIANDGSSALWGIRDGSSDQFSLDYYSGSAWTNWLTLNTSGLLTVSGFGTHSFSAGGNGVQRIAVSNTTSGTGAFTEVYVENAATDRMVLRTNSALFTPSTVNVASGGTLSFDGGGGMSIAASHASGAIRFYTGGTTLRGEFLSTGGLRLGSGFGSSTTGIDLDGVSGIGDFSRSSGLALRVNRYTSTGEIVRFAYIGGTVGSISTDGTNTAYNTSSDKRLKNDLGLATDLSGLRQVSVHEFQWKSSGQTSRGVFAQDAHRVMPFAVTVGNDEVTESGSLANPWSVDYSKFVPDLIVGWQQHDATISQLAARIAALETKDH